MQVLDHGFANLVESWGSDEAVIAAARMSVGGGFVQWDPYDGRPKGDEGLLAFLWKNNHSTPFEMAGLTIEVRAPLFVFREWHRHRTFSYSEASARYSPLLAFDYVPTTSRMMVGAGLGNKQAGTIKDAEVLTETSANQWLNALVNWQEAGEHLYQDGLAAGVPKELARLAMTVGRYSTMRASGNLRNWLGFLKLRQAPNAQQEIREYANAVHHILTELFPRTLELFDRA